MADGELWSRRHVGTTSGAGYDVYCRQRSAYRATGAETWRGWLEWLVYWNEENRF